MLRSKAWLLSPAMLLVLTQPAVAKDSEEQCIEQATSIDAKIKCLKDVRIVTDSAFAENKELRQFDLRIKQPIDYNNPKSETFEQRIVLLHRSTSEPMVLQTSGYSIFSIRESVLAATFGANQIQVEHRFFKDSVPAGSDWSKLDIFQSANDFHRITVAFKKIYNKNWVNTGASKGGMTSVYHHYFFPDDLNGTVADVAPLSFSVSDERYPAFLQAVGGEEYKDCRAKIHQFQVNALSQREAITPKISGRFTQLESIDMAFEHAVIESEFIFWQYSSPTDPKVGCDMIPTSSDPAELYAYLEKVNSVSQYSDDELEGFLAYFYQAATQLGNPGYDKSYFGNLLKYDFNIDQYTPKNVNYSYSNDDMHAVDQWVRNDSERILFVYGEFDPWSAGAFPVRDDEHEVFRFTVPRGNHGSKFNLLPTAEKERAIAIISKWIGKTAVSAQTDTPRQYLEDVEFRIRKQHRRLM